MTENMEGQLDFFDLVTQCTKMSPEHSPQIKGGTGRQCSRKSSESQTRPHLMCLCLKAVNGPMQENSTMKWEDGQLRGDSSMLNFGESPNVGKESLWLLTSHRGGIGHLV